MIEKVLSIKNVGWFVDYQLKSARSWNGCLSKINIIYAPNGSGKTTLSTIFKSLESNDAGRILLKKSFNTNHPIHIVLKQSEKPSIIEFKSMVWNEAIPALQIFDVHYIEDYLYAGSQLNKKNKTNLFKLLLGEEGQAHKTKCKSLIGKTLRKKDQIKSAKKKGAGDISSLSQSYNAYSTDLNTALDEYREFSEKIFTKQINITNKYLATFAPYIRIKEITHEKESTKYETFRIFLSLEVYGKIVKFLAPDVVKQVPNAKYVLSEGDKSALALCFFLASLEIKGYGDRIIIFDDPLSSFDHSRKNTTIANLSKIAMGCDQFFLLTHDITFAKEFTDKVLLADPLNLQIKNDGATSSLILHDIEADTLPSIQRDLRLVASFLKNGADNEQGKREVIRCIRPVLEGALKNKYFDIIKPTEWLGDIIKKVRDAKPSDRICRIQEHLESITELNDYSKKYHHSNNGERDEINLHELRNYSKLLLDLFDKI